MAKTISLSKLLKTWRGKRTQKEIAALLGMSLRTYQNYEYGINVPTDFCIECIKYHIAKEKVGSGSVRF